MVSVLAPYPNRFENDIEDLKFQQSQERKESATATATANKSDQKFDDKEQEKIKEQVHEQLQSEVDAQAATKYMRSVTLFSYIIDN